jgi:U3 small nucleolar RNA-associated protein 23
MRHLYATKDNEIINQAKTFERRRCGHHELEEPLSTLACLSESVDAKDSNTNKHRYVVASQDKAVRAHMRQIPGVPMIYINRSVMIMEPMAEASEDVRTKEERSKFRAGLKTRFPHSLLGKRDRDNDEHQHERGLDDATTKKHKKILKGINPLSMLKPKKRDSATQPRTESEVVDDLSEPVTTIPIDGEAEKRKRKRKSSKPAANEIGPRPAEILTGRSSLTL